MMTERMFQEREMPWHMDKENDAELEEEWHCSYCDSKCCAGDCTQSKVTQEE